MTKHHHLKFNDAAPDIQLLDVKGKPVKLASLWKKRALILAFVRHFGCPQCKQLVQTLSGVSSDFEANDLSLVVVTQGTPEASQNFSAQHAPDVMFLSDAERNAYRAYGLERASVWQTFLSPRVWRSNSRLNYEQGWSTEWPPEGQDAMQLGGIFVIGKDGKIRLPYYYDDIADHPPVDLLLHGVMRVNWKKPFDKPVAPPHRSKLKKKK